ncbi:MAG TPA: protein-L-isoaspartate(D-aspartate) O-methyltransferase [Steroidobacteraceae bacterium]|jgi:protein-L-isoaspartate(D-aspartate) O-methyltransferase|nr:protein-L-isoaspartate(D-aspartate) O-methyltransferase [Steroidobacteraceae bacterium]
MMDHARFAGIGMTSARTRERLVQRLREQGISNLSVLDRVKTVPRHIFVDEAIASRAYEDTALPIGYGQTISQPYIVARMTEALLEGGPLTKVLEVGTGCGYQTAVLAPFVGRIYSVERIEALFKRAKERLKELGIGNVRLKHGDGIKGWKTQAPFDGILIAAAPLTIPDGLIEQLAIGGRLLVPVGPEGQQKLVRITRREQGIERRVLESVAFVPLVGGVS